MIDYATAVPSWLEIGSGANLAAIAGCFISAGLFAQRTVAIFRFGETEADLANLFLHAMWTAAAILVAILLVLLQLTIVGLEARDLWLLELAEPGSPLRSGVLIALAIVTACKLAYYWRRVLGPCWFVWIALALTAVGAVGAYGIRLL